MKPVTRIRSVSFRSSVQIKSFQHVHVEASADVPLNRTPESVLDDVKKFVARELLRAKNGEIKQETRQVLTRGGAFKDLLSDADPIPEYVEVRATGPKRMWDGHQDQP